MYKRVNTYTHICNHIHAFMYIYILIFVFSRQRETICLYILGHFFLLTLPTANTLDLLKAEDAIWEAQRSGLMICFPLLQTYRFARSLDKRISQDVKLIFTSEMIKKNKRERVRRKSCRNVTWKIDWSNHLNEDVLIMKLWRHLRALSQWLQEDFMGDPCIQAMLNLNLGLTQITRQLRSSFSTEVTCQFPKKAPYSARICGSRYLSHHLHLWFELRSWVVLVPINICFWGLYLVNVWRSGGADYMWRHVFVLTQCIMIVPFSYI